MKTFRLIGIVLCSVLMNIYFTSCKYDDSELWDNVNQLEEFYNQLEDRVTQLETLCKKNNENITSLQAIVEVLQAGDYITEISPITNDNVEIGYIITFSKKGTITIYHGKDGKNGENGKDGVDGKDGHTPIIGVKQDTDGVYYWTIDGEFIVVDGQKMYVQGKDGENGKDGINGTNGKDGNNGVTPQFKIEDGYWYISYDNGISWTSVGKATGDNGKDGENANYIFKDITYDNNNVYFTLADGTVIIVERNSSLLLPIGEEFNSTISTFLNNNVHLTKIKFVAKSELTSDDILVIDLDGTIGYLIAKDDCLEIHTSAKKFVANENCLNMFIVYGENKFSITSIDFNDVFDTSNVTNMRNMFSCCEALTTLDVSNFDTSNVTNMRCMFYSCDALTSLDVSNFDTSKVTDMDGMFYECTGLTTLDVSNFDTSNVSRMWGMFYGCRALTSLNLSTFDTSKVTDMSSMFGQCYALKALNLSSFEFKNNVVVTNMFSPVGAFVPVGPVSIKVTEEGYVYLTETTSDCGIDYSCQKFVKPDGTDW